MSGDIDHAIWAMGQSINRHSTISSFSMQKRQLQMKTSFIMVQVVVNYRAVKKPSRS